MKKKILKDFIKYIVEMAVHSFQSVFVGHANTTEKLLS